MRLRIVIVLLVSSALCGAALGKYVFYKTDTRTLILDRAVAPFSESMLRPQGPAGAPITLIEFSDLQCPFCARNQATMLSLLDEFPGLIRYHSKSYPLSEHKYAMALAKAVVAAEFQGKGSQMREALFAAQEQFGSDTGNESAVYAIAQGLGLNADAFKADWHSPASADILVSDIEDGNLHEIRSTPTVFVNGYRVEGALDIGMYRAILEKFLAEPGASATSSLHHHS
jgi:predicted DsbA family dithiol-disulfide isomerase